MGQFKPMTKMSTTEPSVVLKLKKGGSVKKMQVGGLPAGAPAVAPRVPVRRPMVVPAGRATAPMPVGRAPLMRKEGGESKAEHKAEMSAVKGLRKEMTSHEAKPASKAHKGLKTGGVANAQGGYKTGGVANAQGGYKRGGRCG